MGVSWVTPSVALLGADWNRCAQRLPLCSGPPQARRFGPAPMRVAARRAPYAAKPTHAQALGPPASSLTLVFRVHNPVLAAAVVPRLAGGDRLCVCRS